MRKGAALGFLFAVGLIIAWTGAMGSSGSLLAGLLCPQQVHLVSSKG